MPLYDWDNPLPSCPIDSSDAPFTLTVEANTSSGRTLLISFFENVESSRGNSTNGLMTYNVASSNINMTYEITSSGSSTDLILVDVKVKKNGTLIEERVSSFYQNPSTMT